MAVKRVFFPSLESTGLLDDPPWRLVTSGAVKINRMARHGVAWLRMVSHRVQQRAVLSWW